MESRPNFMVRELELFMELYNSAIAILFGFQSPAFSNDNLHVGLVNFGVGNSDTRVLDERSQRH